MTTDNEPVFKHTDSDRDEMEVGPLDGDLIFSNYGSEGGSVSVRLEPARVNDLHSALGAWMAENGITARTAVQPEADGVTFSGLAARVTEMERRQADSHQSLTASLEQDADRISNLNSAMNRAHRRLDDLVGRTLRLEESDISTVPDLSRTVGLHGARLDDLETTQRGASEEFNEKEAAEEIGEIVKGLAYLRASVDSMHKDLFRQASGLHTSATMQRTGAHEALVGLLTEIRDRLQVPPPRCNDLAPDRHSQCDLPEDHTGRHAQGTSSWPQICGEPSPFHVDETCQGPSGHSGVHHNGMSALRPGRKVWERT